ncbi:hexose kinase [Vagococcus zengguangii]|uniref:Tagatose-6-phosphate kinase n=1 Tax=Vagococcus zengguangii TaxID=2571750 RepID=A0A4D7CSG7_9ENTE|nr:hexose kinase [Vagococcus zengguangii]QCI86013.1 tagatose-6-phosphate kinase [Vagococcus zengguangii]TLG80242.1 tagatose-6-phosphate kinase [Vagococcus zengguangii]
MIVSVTLNPTVELVYDLESLNINGVTRTNHVNKFPSGKGLNVSRVATLMGYDNIATGLLGDNLKQVVESSLDEDGMHHQFFQISGQTRNSVAVLHDGQQTEILEEGPTITADEANAFIEHYDTLIADAQVVALAGSLPQGLTPDYYIDLMHRAQKKQAKVIIDASGSTLKEVLASPINPFAIKPNLDEIQELSGQTIDTRDYQAIIQLLDDAIFEGIELIVISMGADGAFVKYGQRYFKASVPSIEVENAVGSGDSTVAGIAIALDQNEDIETLIKRAMTLGTLNALEKRTGYVTKENYPKYFDQTTVTEIKRT